MILALATGLARTFRPNALKRASVKAGPVSFAIEATSLDEVETLEQILDDADRYGGLSQDVVEMTRQRHADGTLELSQGFRKQVGRALDLAERNPGMTVTVTAG